MGRLIEADEAKSKVDKTFIGASEFARDVREGCYRAIDAAPTVDAVEVVRCKDCRFRGYECSIHREGSFYCADGERKDGGPSAAEHSHEIAGKAHNNAGSEAAENER